MPDLPMFGPFGAFHPMMFSGRSGVVSKGLTTPDQIDAAREAEDFNLLRTANFVFATPEIIEKHQREGVSFLVEPTRIDVSLAAIKQHAELRLVTYDNHHQIMKDMDTGNTIQTPFNVRYDYCRDIFARSRATQEDMRSEWTRICAGREVKKMGNEEYFLWNPANIEQIRAEMAEMRIPGFCSWFIKTNPLGIVVPTVETPVKGTVSLAPEMAPKRVKKAK